MSTGLPAKEQYQWSAAGKVTACLAVNDRNLSTHPRSCMQYDVFLPRDAILAQHMLRPFGRLYVRLWKSEFYQNGET